MRLFPFPLHPHNTNNTTAPHTTKQWHFTTSTLCTIASIWLNLYQNSKITKDKETCRLRIKVPYYQPHPLLFLYICCLCYYLFITICKAVVICHCPQTHTIAPLSKDIKICTCNQEEIIIVFIKPTQPLLLVKNVARKPLPLLINIEYRFTGFFYLLIQMLLIIIGLRVMDREERKAGDFGKVQRTRWMWSQLDNY